MANNSINVLMMGARRAGKTSVLSGLFNLMTQEDFSKLFVLSDVSVNKSASEKLQQKSDDIKLLLANNVGKSILMEDSGTDTYLDYTLEIRIPGGNGSLLLSFTDSNGEFYAAGAVEAEDVKKKMQLYDIIVVAIDTPFLMGSFNRSNTLCSRPIGDAYNQVAQVHNLMASIDDGEGLNAKLVCFVPIKCERWVHEGRINEVTQRVEDVYSATLRALCAFKNIEVVVLPVQTVGNLEFEAHRKALTIVRKEQNEPVRCSPYDDEGSSLLLANGNVVEVQPGDIVTPDHKARLEGFSFVRPNSWFKVVSNTYEPHNCDQLVYYILQFALAKSKLLKSQKRKKWSLKRITVATTIALGFGIPAAALYVYFSGRLGSIKSEKLQASIDSIRDKGLWKTSEEGIKVLNKGLLP